METEKKTLDPAVALTLIQAAEERSIEQDDTLRLLISVQSERMNAAAKILSVGWNGAFNPDHVKAIAFAYADAIMLQREQTAKQVYNVQTPEGAGKEAAEPV